ncbi:DoxX family protein [Martelella alba]|uniref:DoxX family protein n=1 Tax=Martelella alba TaxID=2590451 RepID=A0A506UEF3_9HYPH|nr:DoxX family protein [Martelella alba]TPW31109.1 DoxX family protein [Martelella alba]
MTLTCRIKRLHTCAVEQADNMLKDWFPGLFARFAFAAVLLPFFISSFRTKVEPGFFGFFHVRASAWYQIALPAVDAAGGDLSKIGFFPWGIIVLLGTYAEIILPFLIVFGLFTRIAALGMIGFIAVMSLVDITVHQVDAATIGSLFDRFPDATILDQRLLWTIPLVQLAFYGAGAISLDRLLSRFCRAA